jgi:DNA-binding FadR family transcriptional regulator
MSTLRPISTTSIHDEIQLRIKEYIVANELQPGDPLPSETELTEQLGVSRAVVREALRSLEALGVIVSRRGEGRFVSEFNLDPIVQSLSYGMLSDLNNVRDILEVRERLEASFIAEAISAMDEATLEQLRELVDKMREKWAAGERYTEEDLAFHYTIFLTIGNRLLVKLLELFWRVYHNLQHRVLRYTDDLSDSDVENHAAILEAIEAQDADLARQRILDHFTGLRRRLNESEVLLSKKSSIDEV